LEFWKEKGIKENLLNPQFHGREHLNPRKWLAVLKEGVQMEMDAFNEKVLLGLSVSASLKERNYMAAFEHTSEEHKEEIKQTAIEGLTIFEQLFGFKSLSFMPSQSKQFEQLNETLVNQGVLFNQGGQYFISDESGAFKKVDKFFSKNSNTISKKISKGNSLSESLGFFPEIFSDLYKETLKVGEETGSLEESLKILDSQMQR
jgi:hypothetical protein